MRNFISYFHAWKRPYFMPELRKRYKAAPFRSSRALWNPLLQLHPFPWSEQNQVSTCIYFYPRPHTYYMRYQTRSALAVCWRTQKKALAELCVYTRGLHIQLQGRLRSFGLAQYAYITHETETSRVRESISITSARYILPLPQPWRAIRKRTHMLLVAAATSSPPPRDRAHSHSRSVRFVLRCAAQSSVVLSRWRGTHIASYTYNLTHIHIHIPSCDSLFLALSQIVVILFSRRTYLNSRRSSSLSRRRVLRIPIEVQAL